MEVGDKKRGILSLRFRRLCQIPNWGLFITESNMLTKMILQVKYKEIIN